MMTPDTFDLDIRLDVLGVREDDAWCAIALDMSLRGYGETFEDALSELHEAVVAQITFAIQHDTLDDIFIPAEPEYCTRFAEAKRKELKRKAEQKSQEPSADTRVGGFAVPTPERGTFIVEAQAEPLRE